MLRHPIVILVRHILGASTAASHCCLTHTLTMLKIHLVMQYRKLMELDHSSKIVLCHHYNQQSMAYLWPEPTQICCPIWVCCEGLGLVIDQESSTKQTQNEMVIDKEVQNLIRFRGAFYGGSWVVQDEIMGSS